MDYVFRWLELKFDPTDPVSQPTLIPAEQVAVYDADVTPASTPWASGVGCPDCGDVLYLRRRLPDMPQLRLQQVRLRQTSRPFAARSIPAPGGVSGSITVQYKLRAPGRQAGRAAGNPRQLSGSCCASLPCRWRAAGRGVRIRAHLLALHLDPVPGLRSSGRRCGGHRPHAGVWEASHPPEIADDRGAVAETLAIEDSEASGTASSEPASAPAESRRALRLIGVSKTQSSGTVAAASQPGCAISARTASRKAPLRSRALAASGMHPRGIFRTSADEQGRAALEHFIHSTLSIRSSCCEHLGMRRARANRRLHRGQRGRGSNQRGHRTFGAHRRSSSTPSASTTSTSAG